MADVQIDDGIIKILNLEVQDPTQPQSSPNILKPAGQTLRGKQSRLGWGISREAKEPNRLRRN